MITRAGVSPSSDRYQCGISAFDSGLTSANTAHVRVSVLGPLTTESVDGALGPRDRVVLSALALECREVVGGARLADALWGDEVPASWNKVVQGCVVRLRRALGSATIETHPLGYRLTLTDDDLDTRRFEHQLSRARELLALGESERSMYAADEALALWRGQPFIDVDHWEPAQVEAHRLSELHLDAEELRIDAALRSGRHREVLASARACVEAAPTRERRWELLALAQYRAGQQGDALRTLREARAVLVREVGVDPGPELVALEQAILQQDERLAPPEVPAEMSGSCPWPGLPAYGVDDAEEFFGRDAEVTACVERLTSSNIVVVVGPSGSGKSSLVRAGVSAALRRNGRRVVVVTPGAHPVDALTALPANGERPVLVVDQCEEAIVSCSDLDERDAFFEALIAHAAHAPLVIALRADHVGDFSAHDDIARLVERGLFLLGPMSEANLRAAIEGPARRAALLLEPGLVDLVVRDVVHEPGALPLMSHALRQTWAGRQGRTLTVAAYRETGGIRGAVAQSAEAVYENIDVSERPKLRELLLRLVSPVENGEPTRARVPRHSFAEDANYAALVERLVAARLLTSDGDAVELAHEALARAWPRLKDWLDEDVDGLRVLRHVTAAANGWDALGRPDTELYRGVRLAQAVAWREQTHPQLTAVERTFLDRSVEVEAADLLVAQAQITHQRRTVRRLRRLVVGVAVFAAIAIVASLVAFNQRNRADDESRVAAARRLSAEALVARPHDRALLLAVEAVRLWDSDETRGNLLTTIGRSPHVAGVVRGRGQRLLDIELQPAGTTAAVADGAGAVTLYDMTTRREVGALAREGSFIQAPAFSPDGDVVAVSRQLNSCRFGRSCETGIDVFGTADLQPHNVSYQGFGSVAADLEYSPDGTMLAAAPHFAWAPGTENIAIWRVDQPDAPVRRLTLPNVGVDLRETPDSGPPGWLAFSPDGTQLYASGAGPTTVFDVATGQVIRSFDGLGAMALSPDGRTLAIATPETSVQLVDTATGAVPRRARRSRRVDHRGHVQRRRQARRHDQQRRNRRRVGRDDGQPARRAARACGKRPRRGVQSERLHAVQFRRRPLRVHVGRRGLVGLGPIRHRPVVGRAGGACRCS